MSAATACTDSGLTAGTTYYYEIEAGYYDVNTLWVSSPDTQFSGVTSQASSGPVSTGAGREQPDEPESGYHQCQLDKLLGRNGGHLPGDRVRESGAHLLEHCVQRLYSVHLADRCHVLQYRPSVGHSWR